MTASSNTWSCCALAAVERSRVCLILIDANDGVTEQDRKVAGYAHEQGKACIIVVNKWDMWRARTATPWTHHAQKAGLRRLLQLHVLCAHHLHFGAKTGQHVNKLIQPITLWMPRTVPACLPVP